jgi:hypothetical protein
MLKLAQQLVHGELCWPAHKAANAQPMLAPLDAWDGPMIAHVVQGRWCYEAMLHEHIGRRLHIEGVPAKAVEGQSASELTVPMGAASHETL